MKGVQEIYGLHNYPNAEEGYVLVKEGHMMAGICGLKITIKGKGGHGAFPHMVKDCITAACNIHTALHSINSRLIDCNEQFILTICSFNAGTAKNVFPDECKMTGTVRAFSEHVLQKAMQHIKSISNHIAEGLGCIAEVEFQGLDTSALPVTNSKAEA